MQVLQGGVNLLDKVDQLKQRSAATKQELAVRARQEQEHKRRLQQLQSQQVDFSRKYASLEVCVIFFWVLGGGNRRIGLCFGWGLAGGGVVGLCGGWVGGV